MGWLDSLVDTAKGLVESASDVVSGVVDTAKSVKQTISDTASKVVSTITKSVSTQTEAASKAADSIASSAKSAASSAVDAAKSAVASATEAATPSAVAAATTVVNQASGYVNTASDIIQAANEVKAGAEQFFTDRADKIITHYVQKYETLDKAVDAAVDFFGDKMQVIVDANKDFIATRSYTDRQDAEKVIQGVVDQLEAVYNDATAEGVDLSEQFEDILEKRKEEMAEDFEELAARMISEVEIRPEMSLWEALNAAVKLGGFTRTAFDILKGSDIHRPGAEALRRVFEVLGDSVPDGIEKVIIGVYKWSGLDSWSKVCYGYSFIEGKPTEPDAKDLAIVVFDLALMGAAKILRIGGRLGLSTSDDLAKVAGRKLTAVPAKKVSENLIEGAASSSIDDIVRAGRAAAPAGGAAVKTAILPKIAILIKTSPTAARALGAKMAAEFAAHPLFAILGIGFLLSQMDVLGWGFGLFPEKIRGRMETLIGKITSDFIKLDMLIRERKFSDAREIYEAVGKEFEELDNELESRSIRFWEFFGFDYSDVRAMRDSIKAVYDSYGSKIPEAAAGVIDPEQIPETITGTVTHVVDGDTLWVNDKYNIRLVGIDAPELGKEGSVAAADYLSSLVLGKTVTVKVDPDHKQDEYPRILGVVFVNDMNVNLELARLGLAKLFFVEPNKYVDRVEWTRVVEGAKVELEDLKIASSPSNARIYINGLDQAKYTTETFELPEATYRIRLTKEGYKDYETTVKLFIGEPQEIFCTLEELEKPETEGKLSVSSSPEVNAYIYLNGVYTSFKTPKTFPYAAGDYDLVLVKKGYSSEPYKVRIFAGELATVTVSVTERPEDPEEENTSTVSISSNPVGAYVYIDGIYSKHKTPYVFNLSPGAHTIRLTKTKYDDFIQDIMVEPKTETAYEFNLTVTPEVLLPILSVTSVPIKAYIFIDGLYTGHLTPHFFTIKPGIHTIRVEKAGYLPAEISIEVIT